MNHPELIKAIKVGTIAAIAGLVLVACGSDDNADGSSGGNNAPNVPTSTTASSNTVQGGVMEGDAESTESTDAEEPQPTVELKKVDATPLTRRGSDGSMATNSGTPEASPAASPEASPAASPEASPAS